MERPLWYQCKHCKKQSNVCQCVCKTCGDRPVTGSPMEADGRCHDCTRHPPGTKWKGGTIPKGCDLYVMPKGWEPGDPIRPATSSEQDES